MHTTITIPAPSTGRYAVAVVGDDRIRPEGYRAYVYFEHGGYAELLGSTYNEAEALGHACGRTGAVPPSGGYAS